MYFETTDLFRGVSREFIDKVSQALTEQAHVPGSLVFREGEPAEYFYFLESGRVRITVGEHGAVTKILSEPGEAFGWSSLFGNATHTASATCLQDVRVKKISGRRMNELLEADPASGVIFFRRLARSIGERLTDCYRLLLTYSPEKKPHSYG